MKNKRSPKNLALIFSIITSIFPLIAIFVLTFHNGDSFFLTEFVVFELTVDAKEIDTSIKTARILTIMIFLFIFYPHPSYDDITEFIMISI